MGNGYLALGIIGIFFLGMYSYAYLSGTTAQKDVIMGKKNKLYQGKYFNIIGDKDKSALNIKRLLMKNSL